MSGSVSDAPPVVLVHGWGGSFARTWERSGFTALLSDAGRRVVGIDLLGHGTAPKPHDPEAYRDLPGYVLAALPEEPVDAIGFSMGALMLLRLAVAQPHRFRRLVLAGIGRNAFARDEKSVNLIIEALENGGATEHGWARLFAKLAAQPCNDAGALVAMMKAPRGAPIDDADLARVSCPTLVIVGEHDFANPADRLVGALPDARVVTLPRADHFAVPESLGFIDATLRFLGAVPV